MAANEATGAIDIYTEDLVGELLYAAYSFKRPHLSAEQMADIYGPICKRFEDRYQSELKAMGGV